MDKKRTWKIVFRRSFWSGEYSYHLYRWRIFFWQHIAASRNQDALMQLASTIEKEKPLVFFTGLK